MKNSFSLYILFGLMFLFSVPMTLEAQDDQRLALSEEALNNAEYDECLKYLDEELKEHPKNSKAWLLLSKTYQEIEELDQMKAAAQKGLKYASKQDSETRQALYVQLITLALYNEENDEALKLANQMIKEYAQDSYPYLVRAKSYEIQDKQAEAIADYKKVVEMNPSEAHNSLIRLAQYAYNDGDPTTALRYLEQALANDTTDNEIKTLLSACYFCNKQYEKAVDLCLDNIDNNDLGELLTEYADSVATAQMVNDKLQQRIDQNPNDTKYLYVKFTLCYQQNKYDEAIEWLKKVYAIDSDPVNLTTISLMYYFQNQYEEALAYADKALSAASDSSEVERSALLLKAYCYVSQERIDEEIQIYDRILKENPEDYQALFLQAFARILRGGEDELALTQINKVIEGNPGGVETAYLWRGWLCYKQGKINEAEGAFRYAIENDGDEAPTYCTYISQHFLGIDQTAKETLQKVIEQPDIEPDEYVFAASFYALLGDKPMAMRYLEIAVEKGYNNYSIIKNLPLLQSLKGYADYDNFIKTHEVNK